MSVASAGDETDRRNSFDVIRLFAALCVLLSHQLGMAGYPEPPLGPLGIRLASIGLYIFFALSGYLVCQSWLRRPAWRPFLLARLLRIFPAFWVNMAFCVLLGAAITTLTQAAYWSSPLTWTFIATNLPILTVPTQFALPGVFADARWPIVNGSIWTIKYELVCYLGALLLFTLVASRTPLVRLMLSIALPVIGLLYVHRITYFPNPEGEDFFGYYNAFNLLRFGLTFGAGALYALCEPLDDKTRLTFLCVPAALVVLGPNPEFARAGIILLLTLFVIELGRSAVLYSRAYRSIGDLSYGTFLYGYPVQNLIVTRFYDGTNFFAVTAVVLAAVLLCAYVSWRFVEEPALRLKRWGVGYPARA